jgi:hypothetical protein
MECLALLLAQKLQVVGIYFLRPIVLQMDVRDIQLNLIDLSLVNSFLWILRLEMYEHDVILTFRQTLILFNSGIAHFKLSIMTYRTF